MNKSILRLVAASALLVLAACGGGGDTAVDGDEGVPSSALASWEVFSRWVGSRPVRDGAEPLSLDSVSAPTSDSDEPIEAD